MSKENFNAMMKRAFTENKAIGFTAYKFTTGGESLHAMTIWGAEFDEEGYVSHIYYCDNNLVDQDANGAAIIRLGITYDENPAIPSMGDVAYTIQLPKPFGGSRRTSLITALVLVDLRQDIWKQAFGDVE
ncbi:IdeS/Mac family cysteine endopeptidase [uncultured Barnesiella sp.]|uniref:IdeS/Mac family cysteine endopeptidase n=1 Tax=uncultured Barnesiella sp. TaxID=584861 RepID=UPI00262DA9FD|nr:IdeS/Mac family cysteine endopeptidase [uncultured Barnesiella sp.]